MVAELDKMLLGDRRESKQNSKNKMEGRENNLCKDHKLRYLFY